METPWYNLPREARRADNARVASLPLFPLDLVLFPNMVLPLYIFEERYKELVNRCVHESLPFGIVLAVGVEEETGRVETSPVGCTARIARVERLPDGCMNIEVVGEERFRILDTHEQESYRTGLIEPYEDVPPVSDEVLPTLNDVQRLLRDFLTRSLALAGQEVGEFELPARPSMLSFMAACVLPIPNEEKQGLLAEQSVLMRLSAAKDVLLKEVMRLRRVAETTQVVWSRVELSRFDGLLCDN